MQTTIISNTTFDGTTLNFDPSDWKGMFKLMERADEFTEPAIGKNLHQEKVMISVNHDNITVETFQWNGWVRQTVYWDDGTVEELFNGRWI